MDFETSERHRREHPDWNQRSGTTIARQRASRLNGLKGGRPRIYLSRIRITADRKPKRMSANAVRQQEYRIRNGLSTPRWEPKLSA